MAIAPLAIVQARIGSTRLPRKMLLPLGGKPLIYWAWNTAVETFGPVNVICAIPASKENDELAEVLGGFEANVFRWDGLEFDVLGRFYHCAHTFRWRPDSTIVRITPDDPFKSPEALRASVSGYRPPVELGGEAFTLAMLDEAHRRIPFGSPAREHITDALFPCRVPLLEGEGVWTIDTQDDLDRARECFSREPVFRS